MMLFWATILLFLDICQAVTNDARCLARKGGVCQFNNKPCQGTSIPGLCASSDVRRCCIVSDEIEGDSECHAKDGRCQYAAQRCKNGRYIGAKCSGAVERKCCVSKYTVGSTSETSDSWCEARGGVCQYTSRACPGGYANNLCRGTINIQCCIGGVYGSGLTKNGNNAPRQQEISLLLQICSFLFIFYK
ncbi:hypothetical protein SNE40_012931 [Patella caerulea]|uniref:Uncharacterized protein n=1 Tax=Patella caerulea TaxID=87958 RepID=A0AAN8JID4_PATCE